MSEQLSFDGFVAKIHAVFEGLPDHCKFYPNLRYSSLLNDGSIPEPSPRTMKDAALGAFAMFFSQSPSFWLTSRQCSKRKGGTMRKVYLASSKSRETNQP
jgi:hypothetical protein